jgi:dolichol-phosphate mannosyltransferase
MASEQQRDKLALVIPTLNEAGNIQTLLNRLQNALATVDLDYELLVVDDNSPDGTADVVSHYAESDRRVRLMVRKRERGLAGAVIHGWSHTDANLLGVIDADLQHPPEVIPQLLAAIDGDVDIAIGSRYATRNKISNWSKARQLISRLGTWATMPLQRRSGVRVKDPLSGLFIVRRECLEEIELQPQGFKILLEILVKARIHKAVEVPFTFASRNAGKSKADVKVAWQYFSLLGKLSRHTIFGPGPQ